MYENGVFSIDQSRVQIEDMMTTGSHYKLLSEGKEHDKIVLRINVLKLLY